MMGRKSLLYVRRDSSGAELTEQRISSVEALALRARASCAVGSAYSADGGPAGHAAHVQKLRNSAAKAKQTRVKVRLLLDRVQHVQSLPRDAFC